MAVAPEVVVLADAGELGLRKLLGIYGIRLRLCPDGEEIPGSYWGAPEAGLVGRNLYARRDTPVHSILHEAGHYVCMSPARRARLDTDAGGSYDEENCVCYLQILLADCVPGFGRDRMFADMDTWGYSFRLGSARSWFERDACDAERALRRWRIIDGSGRLSWRLRESPRAHYCDASRA